MIPELHVARQKPLSMFLGGIDSRAVVCMVDLIESSLETFLAPHQLNEVLVDIFGYLHFPSSKTCGSVKKSPKPQLAEGNFRSETKLVLLQQDL